MAGEYSRELSTKVFAGQCRLIELGYRQGGPAGFGLRRMLVDQSGMIKSQLGRGEHKSIQTDRVVLAPGPDDEVNIIKNIYRNFVSENQSEQKIANELNARGILTDSDRNWTKGTVHQILINEKYIGNNIWNRVSFKLKKSRVQNEPGMWIRAEGAFEGIIDRQMFEAAQAKIASRSFRLSNEEMLTSLRGLFERKGMLSGLVIDETDGLPSSSAYRSRFDSLLRAYSMVGYTQRRDYRYIAINQALRRLYPDVVTSIMKGLGEAGATVRRLPTTDLIDVSEEFSLSVVIARCRRTPTDALRWRFRFDTGLRPDITVAVRMDSNNRVPFDYYLFPRIDLASESFNLAEVNELQFDAYRLETLDFLYKLARRTNILEAA